MDLDKEIGSLIKLRRKEKSMTQQDLADKLGITYQQIQKYETGVNRLRASLLRDISNVLDVNITYFFQDLGLEGVNSISDSNTLRVIKIINMFESDHEKSKFVDMIYDMAKIVFNKGSSS